MLTACPTECADYRLSWCYSTDYCTNLPGAFICSCPPNLVIDPRDGISCVSPDSGFFTTTRGTTTNPSTTTPRKQSSSTTRTTVSGGDGTVSQSTTTTTPAAQYLSMKEELVFSNPTCVASAQHLVLVQSSNVQAIIRGQFAQLASESDITISIVPVSGTIVLTYSVSFAAEEQDTARYIALEVARLVETEVESIDERNALGCIFFQGLNLTRTGQLEVMDDSPEVSNASQDSTSSNFTMIPIIGMLTHDTFCHIMSSLSVSCCRRAACRHFRSCRQQTRVIRREGLLHARPRHRGVCWRGRRCKQSRARGQGAQDRIRQPCMSCG